MVQAHSVILRELLQVRNNIMVALADLCMQWTALVDPYIPRLASCMEDANELVRRQGLALLTNLLLKVTFELNSDWLRFENANIEPI